MQQNGDSSGDSNGDCHELEQTETIWLRISGRSYVRDISRFTKSNQSSNNCIFHRGGPLHPPYNSKGGGWPSQEVFLVVQTPILTFGMTGRLGQKSTQNLDYRTATNDTFGETRPPFCLKTRLANVILMSI